MTWFCHPPSECGSNQAPRWPCCPLGPTRRERILHDVILDFVIPYLPDNTMPRPREVRPFDIDVGFRPGNTDAFDVGPGRTVHQRDFVLPAGGRLLGVGGHLHDYGESLALMDMTTGKMLFELKTKSDAEGKVSGVARRLFGVTRGRAPAARRPELPRHRDLPESARSHTGGRRDGGPGWNLRARRSGALAGARPGRPRVPRRRGGPRSDRVGDQYRAGAGGQQRSTRSAPMTMRPSGHNRGARLRQDPPGRAGGLALKVSGEPVNGWRPRCLTNRGQHPLARPPLPCRVAPGAPTRRWVPEQGPCARATGNSHRPAGRARRRRPGRR